MAKNDARRAALADAGLRVLAREGARGLTHRAVDAEADVPRGTSSNYFASRDAMIEALVARIGERLAPAPDAVAGHDARPADRALSADYLRDIVRRLMSDRDATIALLELRLEASRRPAVADALGAWYRVGFEADVAFNASAGLPGGRDEIALFHYALDGLLLDRLTVSIDPETTTDEVIDLLVARLLS